MKMKKSVLIPIALVCLILAGIVISTLTAQAARLDPFDYITVSFSGYEGNGNAEVSFAKPALIEDILMEHADGDTPWLVQYDVYDRGIELECTPEEGLSNGEGVTVTVTVSDKANKYVTAGEKTFSVAGLPKVQTVDIFQDIEFTVEGMSGKAWAQLNIPQDDEILRHCNFQIEPQMNLSNGDAVTVTLKNLEALTENYLVMPEETVKTYTVSGLDEYLTDPDLLPEDQIQDIIGRFLVDSEREDWSWHHYTKPEYYKTFFYTALEDSDYVTDVNMLAIYVHIEQYDREEFDQDLYIPLIFKNIVLHPDGTVELDYEQGFSMGLYTLYDADSILAQQDQEYHIEEIYIEYEQ